MLVQVNVRHNQRPRDDLCFFRGYPLVVIHSDHALDECMNLRTSTENCLLTNLVRCRWGTVKEIADATVYLFADTGSYVVSTDASPMHLGFLLTDLPPEWRDTCRGWWLMACCVRSWFRYLYVPRLHYRRPRHHRSQGRQEVEVMMDITYVFDT